MVEQYCTALLNQEKSLEDLQRHLRTTEELFRESVKRKNQQLDLLQSEVRRLKTSVGVRDEAASLQIDAALNAQASELRRAKEALAARDGEVDALTKQVSQLKIELADERARRTAALADDATGTKHALLMRDEEVEGLRKQLVNAQDAAMRLTAASSEAEVAIESRDAELAVLRARDAAGSSAAATFDVDQEELQRLRAKVGQDEMTVRAAEEARAVAELEVEQLEMSRAELAESAEAMRAELGEMRSRSIGGAGGGGGDELEVQRLRSKVEQLTQQLAAGGAVVGYPSGSNLPPMPMAGSQGSQGSVGPAPGGMEERSGMAPQVRSLVVAGDAVVGSTLTAQASFLDADESMCQYAWYRGSSSQPLATGRQTYTVSADDLAHELVVRVTPVASSGAVGDPLRASPSHPIALPLWLRDRLREWLGLGQKGFTNCAEGDKERHVLFRGKGLKVQDKGGKTLAKSDGYNGVAVRLDVDNSNGFTLTIVGKRAAIFTFHLTAPAGVRDLVLLVLRAFTDSSALDQFPVVPTNAASSSLHLSAIGSIMTPKEGGGGPSPASSITSEQQSLADVEESGTVGAASSSTLQRKSSSLAAAGRRLSFTRGAKKK